MFTPSIQRMRIWFSDELTCTFNTFNAWCSRWSFQTKSTTLKQQLWMKSQLCSHLSVNMVQHNAAHASPPWFNTRIMLQDAAFTGKQRAPFSTMIVTKPTILSMLECLCAHCQHMKLSMQALRHHHNSASECALAIQHGAWCRCVLGAQGVVFKWSAPSSTTIVAEIKLYLCLKNNIICLQ